MDLMERDLSSCLGIAPYRGAQIATTHRKKAMLAMTNKKEHALWPHAPFRFEKTVLRKLHWQLLS
jgi:hypothetical protein